MSRTTQSVSDKNGDDLKVNSGNLMNNPTAANDLTSSINLRRSALGAKTKRRTLRSGGASTRPPAKRARLGGAADALRDDNGAAAAELDDIHFAELDGRYEIIKMVGAGTFGEVWKARRAGSDEKVAIKRINALSLPSVAENEARVLYALRGGPHIPTLHEGITDCSRVSLIMTYIDHPPFLSYLREMTVAEIGAYMYALLTALRYVHECGYVHRDVKPSNFVRSRDKQRYMLLDFGLSHRLEDIETLTKERRREIADMRKRRLLGRTMQVSTSGSHMTHSTAVTTGTRSATPRKRAASTRAQAMAAAADKDDAADTSAVPGSTVAARVHAAATAAAAAASAAAGTDKEATTDAGASVSATASASQSLQAAANRANGDVSHTADAKAPAAAAGGGGGGGGGGEAQQAGAAELCALGFDLAGGGATVSAMLGVGGASASKWHRQRKRFEQIALRAGTRSFRAPEVLLRVVEQTYALDIWSAGVCLLIMITGKCPFFSSPDDASGLLEYAKTFGSAALVDVATKLGKRCTSPQHYEPMDFREIACACNPDLAPHLPSSTFDLLSRMLDLDPSTRASAADCLQHRFFNDAQQTATRTDLI